MNEAIKLLSYVALESRFMPEFVCVTLRPAVRLLAKQTKSNGISSQRILGDFVIIRLKTSRNIKKETK